MSFGERLVTLLSFCVFWWPPMCCGVFSYEYLTIILLIVSSLGISFFIASFVLITLLTRLALFHTCLGIAKAS